MSKKDTPAEATQPEAKPSVQSFETTVTQSVTQSTRKRSIEYVIVALSGMAPDQAKQLAEKFSDKERAELQAAYQSKNAARAKLQAIRDRIADEKTPSTAV